MAKRYQVSKKWSTAPYEEHFGVIRGTDFERLSDIPHPVRFATLEDARDRKNPIFAFECVEVPDR